MSAASMVERVEEAKRTGDWGRLIEAVPYLRLLGLELEERQGQLLGCMRFAPHLVGNSTLPALHGGSLGSLLEVVAQLEVLYRHQSVVLPKTITLTVDYLRSAAARDCWARATLLKQGRRVAVAQSAVWQEDEAKPVAIATVHLLVLGD